MSLHDRVRRFARDHSLWDGDTRVLAAASGGSDSIAMLLLLHDLHSRSEVRLDAVAHLNHAIRAEADADEAFCRDLAHDLGIPFVSSRVDVPALARRRRQSIEVAARGARRRFLDEVMQSRGADRIATAHTQDDQAETVLLRLLRGAGRRGLGAIAPSRGRLIRPVLWATRQELRRELERRGQRWREDSTNADVNHPRNRVRHELLPYLERHFNPAVRASLARTADLARSDEELLARHAAAAAVHVVQVTDGSARLDLPALARLPGAVARRVVLNALSAVRPQTSGALGHVEAVLDVAAGRRGGADIAGLRVEHSRESVVLVRRDPRGSVPARFQADLPIPGEVRLPGIGIVIQAEGPFATDAVGPGGAAGDLGSTAGRLERGDVLVAADGLGPTLIVRSRQPGDRLRPLGLGGSKKLQDLLVDRKVDRRERDNVPIVTDTSGRIVWVAGHAIGEEFRVTDRTNAVIILKLRRISSRIRQPAPSDP
jgi:tRNA(Ile)-lysidine synthase